MGLLSNYCGPDLPFWKGSGISKHKVDRICKIHDNKYKLLQAKYGFWYPYLQFNSADEWMINELKKLTTLSNKEQLIKIVASNLWEFKKKFTKGLDIEKEKEKQRQNGNLRAELEREPYSSDFTTPPKKKPKLRSIDISPVPEIEENNEIVVQKQPPVYNLTSSREANMESAGIAKKSATNETPVDDIPVAKYNPFPKTQNVIMDYYAYNAGGTLTEANDGTSIAVWAYRLNSIYDIATSNKSSENGVPDAPEGTPSVPVGREYWMRFYDYWTVVKCEYKLRLRPTTRKNTAQYTVYLYEHGDKAPPVLTNDTTGVTIPHQYKMRHCKEFKHMCALPENGNISDKLENNVNHPHNWIEFSGIYYPGSIDHDVVEDEQAQIWNKPTEVPPTREILTFHVQRSPTSDNSPLNFNFEIYLKYTVQLKDLKKQFEYITPTTAYPATLFGLQSN